MGVGGILAGWLSDRVGRSRVIWWSVLTFTTCTGLIAASNTYWQIAVMRLVSGFGIAGVYSIGNLLASEYVPTRIRTTVLGMLMAGWSAGYVAAALLSSYIVPNYGWRPLFLCAVVPGIVALIMLRGAPDRPASCGARIAQRRSPARFGRSGATVHAAVVSFVVSPRSRCRSATTARIRGCRARCRISRVNLSNMG
jgi:AAHS family cis,cis-muconate transporter-like MFS transporter